MELRNDDLQPLAQLAAMLGDVLNESRERTARIEELVTRVAHAPAPQTNERTPASTESTRLKRENLALLMEIQRQEYAEDKWTRVLQQNQELLESVVTWLRENKDARTLKEIKDKTAEIVRDSTESRQVLLEDAQRSRADAAKLIELVKTLQKDVDSDINGFGDAIKARAEAVHLLQSMI